MNRDELAHELWAAAQLAPGEGISDAVARMNSLLAAQPAEAEGFQIARHSKRLVEQLREQLSAVTAERDRLRKDRDDCVEARVHYAGKLGEVMAERDQIRAELDELRKDAERFRHIERDCDSGMRGIYGDDWVEVIDGYIAEYAAMAAKEAEPEHVCSGCGAKGWTGNCLACIPY